MKFTVLTVICFVLVSCGHVRTDGGQAPFDPTLYATLGPSDQPAYAQTVVKREQRDPQDLTLKEIINSEHGQLKKMAIVLFETQFQASRSGLAVGRNVYLSKRGKQILTEKAWAHWARGLHQTPNVEWISRKDLTKSPAFRGYGSPEEDLIMRGDLELGSDDIFWKSGGQEIPMGALMLPRDYQDVSVLYIPVMEMMGGTKPVEQHKHWINDMCKEMGLDAVVLVSSIASWEQGGVDKRSKEVIPEEMKMSLEASILYPFKTYQAAGEKKGLKNLPQKSIPLASYTVSTKLPVKLTVPESEQTLSTIEQNILAPFWSTYRALANLVMERMMTDIRQTQR